MNQIPPIWKEQRAIGWFDVDVLGRLRPQTLFAYLLDAASNHAQGSVFGYEALSAQNLKWVMVKLQLVIRQQPRWGDQVTIETWHWHCARSVAVSVTSGRKQIEHSLPRGRSRAEHRQEASVARAWRLSAWMLPELEDGRRRRDRVRIRRLSLGDPGDVSASRYVQWIRSTRPWLSR